MSLLPVEPAWRLAERAEEHRWLVTGLWSEQAVGIVGGEPKCCKSFLALDLAVAVASGMPCLRRFVGAARRPRPALRRRGRAAHRAPAPRRHRAAAGVALADLDIQVITSPVLRLDLDADRRNLAETVARLQPRLLILDPFVRLHRIDENASGEVAPLLAFLRELQRRHGIAVLVVHHARKGGGGVRAGQALRGSSEFHAWGDSNLYLRRDGDDLSLSVEHRAAPSPKPLTIELAQRGDALALEVADRREPVAPAPSSLDDRIMAVLAEADRPIPFAELRVPVPRPRRHAPRAHRCALRRRPRRQNRRRLSPRRPLNRPRVPSSRSRLYVVHHIMSGMWRRPICGAGCDKMPVERRTRHLTPHILSAMIGPRHQRRRINHARRTVREVRHCRPLSGWAVCRGSRGLSASGRSRRLFPHDAEAHRLDAAHRGRGSSQPRRKHQHRPTEKLLVEASDWSTGGDRRGRRPSCSGATARTGCAASARCFPKPSSPVGSTASWPRSRTTCVSSAVFRR